MEAPTTTAEAQDGSILSIRPQTKLVFNAFQDLKQKAEEALDLARNVTPYSVRLVTLFIRRLESEILHFRGTLAELTDNNYRAVEGVDWIVVEKAVESSCVSDYARYCDILSGILQELGSIAELLGFTGSRRSSEIRDLVSKRARLLQALCTLDGSAGAALQISFTKIQKANEELVTIQRLSQKDPSANFLGSLLRLRDHVNSATDILGAENGFCCGCSKSHQVYMRVKDSLKASESDAGFQNWHQACSLLFLNHSPKGKQWKQVDMKFDTNLDTIRISNAPVSETAHQEKHNEIASKKIEEKAEEKKLEKTKKKNEEKAYAGKTLICGFSSRREDSIKATPSAPAVEASSRTPPTPPAPPMTTEPSDGLCAFLNDNIGVEKDNPVVITIYREELQHKLLLSLEDGRTKPELRWASPLPIHRPPEDTRRLQLSTEQKLQLAHKVAFSLFYLFSTPWVRDSWACDNVYLTWQESSNSIVYPLFLHNATVPDPSVTASSMIEPPKPRIPFTNRLGRFLVELWCGTSWSYLEKSFLASDGPSKMVDADVFILTRLLNWVNDPKIADRNKPFHLEGSSYLLAVQKCFLCDFNTAQLDQTAPLDNENFARWVYRHILRPLQYALEDFQTRQDRFFGARLELSPEKSSPFNAEDTKRLRLFAIEEIEGDKQKKETSADYWFYQYGQVKELVRAIGRERPDEPADRIRVAILDTGVDVTHDDLHPLWLSGQIVYQNFVGTRSDIPQDDDGHGTHVTSILLQMAENVDIYVARVSPDGLKWNSSEVEDAIRWATKEKQVHIISISFGFPNADQSLEGIRKVLLEAHAADVLIFAATGNVAAGNAISFPACLDEVISVSSTDGNHELSKFVPDLRVGKRLCAIGEAIEAAWIDQKGSNLPIHSSTRRKAGTSYATPVVAGVAAMVMDLIWSDLENFEYQCQTLRTNRGMLAVLELMIWRNKDNGIECLKPWIFFNRTRWTLFSKNKKPAAGMRVANFVILADTLNNIYGKGSSKT